MNAFRLRDGPSSAPCYYSGGTRAMEDRFGCSRSVGALLSSETKLVIWSRVISTRWPGCDGNNRQQGCQSMSFYCSCLMSFYCSCLTAERLGVMPDAILEFWNPALERIEVTILLQIRLTFILSYNRIKTTCFWVYLNSVTVTLFTQSLTTWHNITNMSRKPDPFLL